MPVECVVFEMKERERERSISFESQSMLQAPQSRTRCYLAPVLHYLKGKSNFRDTFKYRLNIFQTRNYHSAIPLDGIRKYNLV